MEKTYTETFSVRSTDCDLYSRMRPDALFTAMQEGGERHARRLGCGHEEMLSRGLFFALTRVHVSMLRAPHAGDTLVHTTWPGNANRFFCPRYHVFSLEDGTPLCAVGTLWVMLDTQQRKIVSPEKVDLQFPDNSDLPVPVSVNARLPMLGGAPTVGTRTPVYSEFDVNGHVNNAKYIAWLCDALGRETFRDQIIGDLVAGYEREIRDDAPKNVLLSREGDSFSFKITSQGGEKHFVAGGTLRREEEL